MVEPPDPSYRVESLSRDHDRSRFSCGNSQLDEYLRKFVNQDRKRYGTAPYVLVREGDAAVYGYYTLSSLSIDPGELPEETVKRLPRYPAIPATLLGRLALDQSCQGKGLGEFLLMHALDLSLSQADKIGSAAVVVDAIDDAAIRFYQHFGFIPFPDHPDRLFIPMKTIKQLPL